MADGAGRITFKWGDGEHTFRLPVAQLRELQSKTNAGPAFLLAKLDSLTWEFDDIRETIRLGLIGGGMKPLEALARVERYVDERPYAENVIPARAILAAALHGVDGDDLEGEVQSPGKQTAPSS